MHHFQWYDGQPYTATCIFLAVSFKQCRLYIYKVHVNLNFFMIFKQIWIQYFYMVTWLWTLSYAVDMWRAYQDKHSCRKLYHFVAWTFPAVFTFIGLSSLYTPDAK